MLIATMTFDDEDPTMHAHFSARAHALDTHDQVEWIRVLRTFEESLREYADRIELVRDKLEQTLTTEAREG